MVLGKSQIISFRQLFAWQKFLERWKRYAAAFSTTHATRRIRFFLDVADYYQTNPPGIAAAPIRANRLYRYVLRQMQPFANDWQLDLNVEDRGAPGTLAHNAYDRLMLPRRRFWRGILAYALTALVGMGAMILFLCLFSSSVRTWVFPPDLAAGRPWRVSETAPSYPGTGVMPKSEDQPRNFFFHTKEMDHPWLDIDLGNKKELSRVQVHNRRDCCYERALPLEVQLSVDGREWKTVARRRGTFASWEAQFSTVQARYVRLTAARRTILHLASVSIY